MKLHYIVVSVWALLITLRFAFPPPLHLDRDGTLPFSRGMDIALPPELYPAYDYETVLLHVLVLTIAAGIILYILKQRSE